MAHEKLANSLDSETQQDAMLHTYSAGCSKKVARSLNCESNYTEGKKTSVSLTSLLTLRIHLYYLCTAKFHPTNSLIVCD